MKRSFFQAAVVSILLYGCTTWTLTKRLKKTLDCNYTRMLRVILNKSCLPSRKLSKLDEPDKLDIAGEARTNSSVMYSYGPPHMAKQKQDNQLEHTYSSYVRIRDVALKTCQKRWMIERSGERGSGISVLTAWHDDDDCSSRRMALPLNNPRRVIGQWTKKPKKTNSHSVILNKRIPCQCSIWTLSWSPICFRA